MATELSLVIFNKTYSNQKSGFNQILSRAQLKQPELIFPMSSCISASKGPKRRSIIFHREFIWAQASDDHFRSPFNGKKREGLKGNKRWTLIYVRPSFHSDSISKDKPWPLCSSIQKKNPSLIFFSGSRKWEARNFCLVAFMTAVLRCDSTAVIKIQNLCLKYQCSEFYHFLGGSL